MPGEFHQQTASLELMTRASLHQPELGRQHFEAEQIQNVMGSVSKDGRKSGSAAYPSQCVFEVQDDGEILSPSATGHQMILWASASDMPITSGGGAARGEKKTRRWFRLPFWV
ncbi:MAG: hypothetical protein ACLSHC_15455 [Bilophila wadsworthia]